MAYCVTIVLQSTIHNLILLADNDYLVQHTKIFRRLSFCLLTIASAPVTYGTPDTLTQDPIDDLLALSDDELLEEIQRATFKYFWDFAHPVSGLARERNTSGDLVTSGGSGFGIMAVLVGIHRDFITRQEGGERILKITGFLNTADRFHGAWPHWLNGNTGKVIPFSARDDGGDLVETAFLVQGLLTARSYFDQDLPLEDSLRTTITELWKGVDWNWYRKQVNQVLTWHWSPTHGFDIDLPVRGWNETMITYILGIASPTHTIPSSTYARGWASNNYLNNNSYYGYKLEVGNNRGGPLFFTHYSFLGFDPRKKRDEFANYFFQGQNQTLINRAWCVENPGGFEGYGLDCWGLTASDDPDGYMAHAPSLDSDNGTITPTAAISSIVYTPEESISAIRHFLGTYREKVWGEMGFYDAFNPGRNWYADSYLAIDQGPIICMIENYRSALLWDYFMRNEEIQEAQEKIGFVKDDATTSVSDHGNEFKIFPNPTAGTFWIQAKEQNFEILSIKDLNGKDLSYISEKTGDSTKVRLKGLNSYAIAILKIAQNGKIKSHKIILNAS